MLVTANNMQAYFREALEVAIRTSKIRVTESAQAYVVHLLNEFSRSETAFAGTDYGSKLNMAHTFTANFRSCNFHAAFFAHDAAIFHAFIFTAQAFVIFDRSKDFGTKQ